MYSVLGSLVDFLHALLMVAWVLGLPLLFVRKHARAAAFYAVYAIAFVLLYQGSRLLLGECFLTSLSTWLWERGGATPGADEWFTVRVALAIFRVSPSHKAITIVGQALVLCTAMGMLVTLRRRRQHDEHKAA
jgi:hypothetical protein